MSFLLLNGTAHKVRSWRRLPDEVGGEPQRTLSGQRRGDAEWRKRGWSGEVVVDDAAAAALYAMQGTIGSRPVVTATGTGIGATASVHVEIGGDEYRRDRLSHRRVLSLTLREV
jgi:hypothetical protein